jgi:hypothetical protein
LYVVLQISMANFLISKGFHVQRIDRNRENRERLIFLFEDSEELRNSLTDYKRDGVAIGYNIYCEYSLGKPE